MFRRKLFTSLKNYHRTVGKSRIGMVIQSSCNFSSSSIFFNEQVQQPEKENQAREETIQIVTEDGKELHIPKTTYREKILPEILKRHWTNPEMLYSKIMSAVINGFASDVLEASKHLVDIDPNKERSTAAFSNVLMRNNMWREAEEALENHIKTHGPTVNILSLLGECNIFKGSEIIENAKNYLWKALQMDPNHNHALSWYLGVISSPVDKVKILEGLSEQKDAWRPKLFLAHYLITLKMDIPRGIDIFKQVLPTLKDAPVQEQNEAFNFVIQDLLGSGQEKSIIEILGPLYNKDVHDTGVGINFFVACCEAKEIEKAKEILDHFKSQNIDESIKEQMDNLYQRASQPKMYPIH